MALNSLSCADVSLSNYSLTPQLVGSPRIRSLSKNSRIRPF